jgi:transcriptional regulator with XRE-family HTH domain
MRIMEDGETLSAAALGIRSRVRRALQDAGITQSDVSRRAQESCPKAARQLLSNAYTRGARPRDPEVRQAFAEALGVDAQWLWFGPRRRPSMMGYESEQEIQDGLRYQADLEAQEEQLRQAKAALPQSAVTLPVRPDPAGYAVPVSTNAYEPLVRVGDCILVSPSYPPAIGALVYVRAPGAEGLYRLVANAGGAVALVTPTGMPAAIHVAPEQVHRVSAIICG